MNEITGDFWDVAANYDGIVVTTNGIVKKDGDLVMGAGIAKDFKQRYPSLPKQLGRLVIKYGNNVYAILGQKPALISFPTKDHWEDDSDIRLIQTSAKQLLDIVNSNKFKKVLLTRPGCGLGNLLWDEVKKHIEFLDNRFDIIEKA